MRDKAKRKADAIKRAARKKPPTKKQIAAQEAQNAADKEAAATRAAESVVVAMPPSQRWMRVGRKRRGNQERRDRRIAFLVRRNDRYQADTVVAMRAAYQGVTASGIPVRVNRNTVAAVEGIRSEDPALAERLFGPRRADLPPLETSDAQ